MLAFTAVAAPPDTVRVGIGEYQLFKLERARVRGTDRNCAGSLQDQRCVLGH